MGILRMLLTKLIPQVFRVILALVAWLVVMPCITSTLYRSLVFRYNPSTGQPTDTAAEGGTEASKMDYIFRNAVSGLLLTGMIIVTFIILVHIEAFYK